MQFDFSQKRLLEKKQFRFIEDGVFIRLTFAGKVHEYELKYENIGYKVIYWKNGLNVFLILAAFFIVASIGMHYDTSENKVDLFGQIFAILLIPLCIALYFLTYKRARYLTGQGVPQPIELFSNKPDTEAVDNFIDEILSRRKQFLAQRYMQFNRNLSFEPQYYNLNWLLETEVINKQEYDQKLAELNGLYPSAAIVTGFRIGN